MKIISSVFTICLFCLTSFYTLYSQDIHFTNYFISPTVFNPAQTGAYAGNLRGSLLYRDQWRSVAPNPFQTALVHLDAPIVFGLTKQHWVGVGMTLFSDRAGSPGQTWSGFIPSIAYHISFDKNYKNVFTIGVQYGLMNRGYNTEGWLSEDEALGDIGFVSPDRGIIMSDPTTGDDFNAGYSDLNVGILFKSRLDKTSSFEIGASMMHLLNPSFRFEQNDSTNVSSENTIDGRINAHMLFRKATSAQMIWEPSIYFSTMPGATNIQFQLRNFYRIDKKRNLALISGLGLRFGDALQILTGVQYNDWLVALSYDYGISELASEGIASAYELGIQKKFIFNKKPKVTPIIYCPRL